MAEDKKDDKKDKKDKKKDSGGGGGGESLEAEIFFWVLISAMAVFITLPTVLHFFNVDPSTSNGFTVFRDKAIHLFSTIFTSVAFFSIFFILIFSLAIFYVKMRLKTTLDEYKKSHTKEKTPAHHAAEHAFTPQITTLPGVEPVTPAVLPIHPRWLSIEKNMQSTNSSDWRLAILEADILLYEMLDQMGIEGQTIAEKLKGANPASFKTLQEAWRAHKVRNNIAHEGASYTLGRTEAEHAIASYKKVFDEFYFI